MRKGLVILLLSLLCMGLQAQEKDVFLGLRLYQNAGLEVGMTFQNRFGFSLLMETDWRRVNGFKRDQDIEQAQGKVYKLMYGAAACVRIAGPVWLSLYGGYGWHGTYVWDTPNNQMAATNGVQGLDLGADVRVIIGKNFYLTAGYETIPAGFKLNRPVHEFNLGLGFAIPL